MSDMAKHLTYIKIYPVKGRHDFFKDDSKQKDATWAIAFVLEGKWGQKELLVFTDLSSKRIQKKPLLNRYALSGNFNISYRQQMSQSIRIYMFKAIKMI